MNASYNRGLFRLGSFNWDTDAVDIGVLLVNNTYVFSRLHNTIADLTPVVNEAAGAGYGRKPIAGGARTVLEDDGANAAYMKVTDGTVTWLGINAGINLWVVLFFVDGVNIADNANSLLGFYDTGVNVPVITNGGDVTLNFNASGAIKLT